MLQLCILLVLLLVFLAVEVNRCWYRCCRSNEFLPFIVEINECCYVLLPRLYIMWIHRQRLLLVGIFVSQSCETMTEFMHNDLLVKRMVCHTKIVRVQYAATAVFGSVHQYDYMFVRSAGKCVVQVLQIERCEVSI